jgi:hypothetical protein
LAADRRAVKQAFQFLAVALLATGSAQAALRIDGVPDEPEWASAQHITDFRVVQPLTRAVSKEATEAWILATPEGLAVAMRVTESAGVRRSRQRTERDQFASVDRVNLVVDYDGDGGTGYNFTLTLGHGVMDAVVVNENVFLQDWDGDWQHAVAEQPEGWSVEMLIPWHVAPMKDGENGKRVIGIYFDRVIAATGERVAWPALSYVEPRFLSELTHIEVPAYSQSLLAVTPYVVSSSDLVHGGTSPDVGADIFWKPNGRFQLTATINPDFGQIESDDLVVNFDAVETFFSDKRPFFTENQGLFEIPFGYGNSSLIYTRRVGGEADDGSGAADVLGALKLNGSVKKLDYGVFASAERGRVGRDFLALRATQDFGVQDMGLLATQVRSPFLDRTANVVALDHHWKPNPRWNMVTQLVGSGVTARGSTERDLGMQTRISNELNSRWRQNLYYLHLGDGLQLNDFGYLERNNFDYLRYEMKRRVTALPAHSMYRSHDWSYVVSTRHNLQGDTIFSALQIGRTSDTTGGGNESVVLTGLSSGYDDLLTRGNGKVRLPARLLLDLSRSWPNRKHWGFSTTVNVGQTGLKGVGSSALKASLQPTYHVNDALSFNLGTTLFVQPDWLLWRAGTLLGSFRGQQIGINAGMQWSAGSRHELRMKLESIALDARALQAWRLQPGGAVLASTDAIDNFSLRRLGFQARYRFEIKPLSYIYVVYSRGGLEQVQNSGESLGSLVSSSFSLRDSEQFLVKFNYRFEL